MIINPYVFAGGLPSVPPTITSANILQWCEPRLLSGLSDGNSITTFTDVSGNANHWSQSTGGAKPIFRATGGPAGLACIEFDGVDDHFTLASDILSGKSGAQVWALLKIKTDPPASSAQSGLWKMDGDGTNAVHFPFTDSQLYEGFASTARKATGVNPTPSLTSWRLYSVSSKNGEFKIYLDGTEIFSTATNTFSSMGSTRTLGRSISLFGNVHLDGYCAGICITDDVVSSTDRGIINDTWETISGLTIA